MLQVLHQMILIGYKFVSTGARQSSQVCNSPLYNYSA